jgi:pentose-5-phosphate-3-epimerase
MIKWVKKLLYIVENFDTCQRIMYKRISNAENFIRERTDVSADVHLTNCNPNQIIVVGRYRNADYVQVFTLADNELKNLIEQLKEMQRYGVVSKIDAPYGMRAVIDKELKF